MQHDVTHPPLQHSDETNENFLPPIPVEQATSDENGQQPDFGVSQEIVDEEMMRLLQLSFLEDGQNTSHAEEGK